MMTIREKLELMEDIKRTNRRYTAEYTRLLKWERRLNILNELWLSAKPVLIAAGVGVLLGYIIIWIAG